MSKRARQASQAQRKLEEMRRQQKARQRLQRLLIGAGTVVVAAVIAVVIIVVMPNRSSTTAKTVTSSAAGATVDGIKCQTNEQVAYHIHVHLAIFVNGVQQPLPRGIGIPGPQTVQGGFVASGKCFYWLHTHDSSGVIHIESPTTRTYTLGQFFDIWGRKLSSDQAGNAKGHLTVFVNGKRFTGDPRSITFSGHKLIQLDVGKVVPPKPYTFAAGL
jgi:hypothetical protein